MLLRQTTTSTPSVFVLGTPAALHARTRAKAQVLKTMKMTNAVQVKVRARARVVAEMPRLVLRVLRMAAVARMPRMPRFMMLLLSTQLPLPL